MLKGINHNVFGILKRKLPSLFIFMLVIYLFGCSTSKNYKTLSFLFDGVPKPGEKLEIQLSDSLNRQDSSLIAQNEAVNSIPKMYVHVPYQEKECATCHDKASMGKLTNSQPDLCYDCHDDFNTKFKVLHGPVGGGQCTACHSPHLAENQHLLLRTGQSLCLYCHEKEQITKIESHQDIGDTNCIECHNPHGGDDKDILN